ncbi:uncharacterized protein CTRU02_207807 [Colletotrichum truncatum]|uniref:Uncharacterized protein n=1 Tax=Colletotrichum truncatum TaxID=5467 RepID=A0ACC3Z1U6_COLTU|nr:uncharacterized protein CTRU02_15151 [Colletotrichum truncatum]KAF6781368.1 hypothetical protein CTRU02_15151 [Colletotrichum truncatum]
MGFVKKVGGALDTAAMYTVNAVASSAPYTDGVVTNVPADIPGSIKGKSEPPPRISKMTWQETLEAEKAAKEKDSQFKDL